MVSRKVGINRQSIPQFETPSIKTDTKLQKILHSVCPEGYVIINRNWYKGLCAKLEELQCVNCNFPGCEFL